MFLIFNEEVNSFAGPLTYKMKIIQYWTLVIVILTSLMAVLSYTTVLHNNVSVMLHQNQRKYEDTQQCLEKLLNLNWRSSSHRSHRLPILENQYPSFSYRKLRLFSNQGIITIKNHSNSLRIQCSFIPVDHKLNLRNLKIGNKIFITQNKSSVDKPFRNTHFQAQTQKTFVVMASSSNTQVSIITKKMEAAKLKEKKTMPVRKAVGSSRAINVGAESWTKSLIGKIMSEDTTKTEFVKDEINLLWKKYRKREVRCVGRNLFIFNLASEKDMEEILKNSPWNVKKCLLSLKKYTPNIAYEDYTFTHQEWTVKFKNLLLEHQSPAMIDEALATLGRKISTDLENCRPRYGSMITARVEMELTKPLQRGDW